MVKFSYNFIMQLHTYLKARPTIKVFTDLSQFLEVQCQQKHLADSVFLQYLTRAL